jgi:hypothetical protein
VLGLRERIDGLERIVCCEVFDSINIISAMKRAPHTLSSYDSDFYVISVYNLWYRNHLCGWRFLRSASGIIRVPPFPRTPPLLPNI